jgi:large subunit ribosomal protein L13
MRKQTIHLTAKAAQQGRQWFIVDAEGQTLGRLATAVATILRGKHKPSFSPHLDIGDFMVVVNAEKIRLTGNKLEAKRYYRHTGYPGGIRDRTAGEVLERTPDRVIRAAVEGMLPKTRLGRSLATKLKIYAGPEHPHAAQCPQPLSLEPIATPPVAEQADNA